MAITWAEIRFFVPEEFGDPSKVDLRAVKSLDQLREAIDAPIVITPNGGTTGGHAPQSTHYLGLGFDIMCPKFNIEKNLRSLRYFWREAVKFFPRVGIYPFWVWNHPGMGRLTGGLHVDRGDLDNRLPSMWWRDGPREIEGGMIVEPYNYVMSELEASYSSHYD